MKRCLVNIFCFLIFFVKLHNQNLMRLVFITAILKHSGRALKYGSGSTFIQNIQLPRKAFCNKIRSPSQLIILEIMHCHFPTGAMMSTIPIMVSTSPHSTKKLNLYCHFLQPVINFSYSCSLILIRYSIMRKGTFLVFNLQLLLAHHSISPLDE